MWHAAAIAAARHSSTLVDLDLDRLGLGPLLDRQLENAILVARLDAVVTRVFRQLESALVRSPMPLGDVNFSVFGQFRAFALGRNYQRTVFDLHIEGVVRQSGHLEVEVISFLVFDYVDRRQHFLLDFRHLSQKPIETAERPSINPSIFKPDFHKTSHWQSAGVLFLFQVAWSAHLAYASQPLHRR